MNSADFNRIIRGIASWFTRLNQHGDLGVDLKVQAVPVYTWQGRNSGYASLEEAYAETQLMIDCVKGALNNCVPLCDISQEWHITNSDIPLLEVSEEEALQQEMPRIREWAMLNCTMMYGGYDTYEDVAGYDESMAEFVAIARM